LGLRAEEDAKLRNLMPDAGDLMKNYASKAFQEIPPLQNELAKVLGVEDETEKVEVIGEGLTRAFLRGVEAGEAEIQAQTVEQGYDIKTEKLVVDDPDAE
jgi:hypothetical protein